MGYIDIGKVRLRVPQVLFANEQYRMVLTPSRLVIEKAVQDSMGSSTWAYEHSLALYEGSSTCMKLRACDFIELLLSPATGPKEEP